MSEADEVVAGIIVRGRPHVVQELIDLIERRNDLKLYFVKRAPASDFLLLLRIKRNMRRGRGN